MVGMNDKEDPPTLVMTWPKVFDMQCKLTVVAKPERKRIVNLHTSSISLTAGYAGKQDHGPLEDTGFGNPTPN